jgi:Ser/Thr protein kinase RdoA (MazF antagonist)
MEADAVAWGAPSIVCHNDVAGWNLVVGKDRWAFIDWDAAGPRPPIWDVAYAAAWIVPIGADTDALGWTAAPDVQARLAALADGYGLDAADRARLPDVIVARIRSSRDHMRRRAEAGIAPWDRLWAGGHGARWTATLRYAERHAPEWRLEG